MINLKRNERTFWYATYKETRIQYDEYGNENGDPQVLYNTPVQAVANISPATGWSDTLQFGNLDTYDKVLVIDDLECPIDENTVLWIDSEPTIPEPEEVLPEAGGFRSNIFPPEILVADTYEYIDYDYIVKRVAKSLNVIAVAVSKVKKN